MVFADSVTVIDMIPADSGRSCFVPQVPGLKPWAKMFVSH